MTAIENIALMTFLMLLGAGVFFAVLAGLVYYLETMDD